MLMAKILLATLIASPLLLLTPKSAPSYAPLASAAAVVAVGSVGATVIGAGALVWKALIQHHHKRRPQ